MKFLNKSFFDDNGDLEGFVLTDYTEGLRPIIAAYGLPEFKRITKEQDCIGFHLDSSGVLYSDSSDCYPVGDESLEYIMNDINKCTHRVGDIVDIILFGLKNSCGIMKEYHSNRPSNEHTIVLVKSFMVSASTFNIYARYKNDDGDFRTLSLFDVEDCTGNEFYFVVGEDVMIPNNIAYMLKQVGEDFDVNGLKCNVYKVTAKLEPYAYLGGAFINYCAYNAEHYLQGVNVIRKYHKQFGTFEKVDMLDRMTKQLELPKKKQPTISITHIVHGKNRYDDIINLVGNDEELTRLVTSDYRARIAYNFLYDLNEKVAVYQENGSKDPVSSACMNLLDKCNYKLLIYSLELLSIRYSIYDAVMNGSTMQLPMVVKGGGVYGDSAIERTAW